MLAYHHLGAQVGELLHQVSEGLQVAGSSVERELLRVGQEREAAQAVLDDPKKAASYQSWMRLTKGARVSADFEGHICYGARFMAQKRIDELAESARKMGENADAFRQVRREPYLVLGNRFQTDEFLFINHEKLVADRWVEVPGIYEVRMSSNVPVVVGLNEPQVHFYGNRPGEVERVLVEGYAPLGRGQLSPELAKVMRAIEEERELPPPAPYEIRYSHSKYTVRFHLPGKGMRVFEGLHLDEV
ncbi:MAG: hypothetical protein Q7S65_00405, partial [Nanoarchaeota archaeon]|nr:hypothetical protein [Nanoarchaeota archaeon]